MICCQCRAQSCAAYTHVEERHSATSYLLRLEKVDHIAHAAMVERHKARRGRDVDHRIGLTVLRVGDVRHAERAAVRVATPPRPGAQHGVACTPSQVKVRHGQLRVGACWVHAQAGSGTLQARLQHVLVVVGENHTQVGQFDCELGQQAPWLRVVCDKGSRLPCTRGMVKLRMRATCLLTVC